MKTIKRLLAGLMLFAFALALVTVPATAADVITKGNSLWLKAPTRVLATTNGVPNPGLPSIFRASGAQQTNHLVITTNGNFSLVRLGTNYIAVNEAFVTITNLQFGAGGTCRLHFVNGLLVSTNWVQGAQ